MSNFRQNETFHNYKLIKRLGIGSYSELWLAENLKTQIQYALKIYAPDKGLDDEGIQIFIYEFRAVSELKNDYLLKPIYYDEFNDSPYLVLPYCERGSAYKLIGKLNEHEIAKFIFQTSSALKYLQSHNIIHQDIKPDNWGEIPLAYSTIKYKLIRIS